MTRWWPSGKWGPDLRPGYRRISGWCGMIQAVLHLLEAEAFGHDADEEANGTGALAFQAGNGWLKNIPGPGGGRALQRRDRSV